MRCERGREGVGVGVGSPSPPVQAREAARAAISRTRLGRALAVRRGLRSIAPPISADRAYDIARRASADRRIIAARNCDSLEGPSMPIVRIDDDLD